VVLELTPDLLDAIYNHATCTYPNECCGLLVGVCQSDQRQVMAVKPMQNAWSAEVAAEMQINYSQGTRDRYWLDPAQMLEVMREARSQSQEIVGVYHSHPDHVATPSECDRQLAWQNYSYLILAVGQGKVVDHQSWVLDDNHRFQSEAILI